MEKNIVTDNRGSPNFDQTAIQISKILEERSYDKHIVYKTVNKCGFKNAEFWELVPKLAYCINKNLTEWITLASSVRMTPEEAVISSNRVWNCDIFGVSVEMPCGGTHLSNLQEIKEVRVEIEADQESGTFEMHTTKTIDRAQVGMRKEQPRSISKFSRPL